MTRRGVLKMAALGTAAAAAPLVGPLVGKVATPRASSAVPPLDTVAHKRGKGLKFHEVYPNRSPEDEARFKADMLEQSADFSKDWRPEEITTPMGERIHVYFMEPKTPKTQIPVTMFKGWTGNAEQWKGTMRQLDSRGRRTMVVDETHGIAYSPDVQARVDTVTDKATYVEYRKIAANMAALDAKKIEKTDAIGHSEGCIDLLLTALAYPERFHNIVLVEPAGMIGSDTLMRLIWRNQVGDVPAMNAAHEAQKRGDPGFQFNIHPDDPASVDTFGPAMDTPAKAALSASELLSIAWIQVADLLRAVKAKGIGIIIVTGAESKMFPVELMAGTARRDSKGDVMFDEKGKVVMETRGAIGEEKQPGESDYSNLLDGFITVKGVHTRFFDQPVEYTQLVEGALTAREALEAEQ